MNFQSANKRTLTMGSPTLKRKDAVMTAMQMAKNRLKIAKVVFMLGFLVIGGRLTNIAFMHELQESYLGDRMDNTGLQTGRADILDREGVVLATSITTSSLYANPRIILNAEEATKKLRQVLPNLRKKELLNRLQSNKSFVWLTRHLTPQQKAQIIRLGIPGIDFMRDQKRVYPYANLTAHVIGFTDVDGNGIAGLEKGLDERLRSESDPLQTSVDLRIQHVLHDELQNGIKEFSSTGASGIVMDTQTGAVVAMVSLPDFDSNHPHPKNKNSLFNATTLGVYEMGSTMKIINTAMALESGQVNLRSRFDATQPIRVGRFQVTDYHGKNSWLNVSEIFVHSSNIGSAKMALKVGPKHQKDFLEKFGLLKPTKLELPEVGLPVSPAKWQDISTITIAYGYGMSTTPIQLTAAVAGIVSDGLMPQPTLLKSKESTTSSRRIISPHTSAQVRYLMQQVVNRGTAGKAKVAGVSIAGKTGTTNYRLARGKGYQTKDVTTYFLGAFPDKPRYVIFIKLDRPRGLKKTFGYNAAGWNAAPIAGRIIKRIAPILNIEPKAVEAESSDNTPLGLINCSLNG